jgi:hypothetical protein
MVHLRENPLFDRVTYPIFHLDGLQNLAGVGVANFSLVGDLINAVVPRDLAPLFGHTALLLIWAKKGIPLGLSVGITDLQTLDYKGNGGEGGIRTLDTGVSPYNGLAIHRKVLNRLQSFLLYSSFQSVTSQSI